MQVEEELIRLISIVLRLRDFFTATMIRPCSLILFYESGFVGEKAAGGTRSNHTDVFQTFVGDGERGTYNRFVGDRWSQSNLRGFRGKL